MQLDRIRVGCSGWQYKHWRGDFYPAEIRTSAWFEQYARTFDTVEINNSFYRWPSPEMFDKWRTQAPPGFLYAVKASRFLTHMKKLKDAEEPLERTFDHVKHLGRHLGPVLYQLPPRWGLNLERLENFLKALRSVRADLRVGADLKVGPYHAIEFREPSWYVEPVFDLLRRYDAALCLHDMHGSSTGRMIVGPFIYARFHFGTQKYGGRYDDARLDEWAGWLADRAREGLPVFAYFNNDTGGHAPRDATRLRSMIRARVSSAA
jgi:uncharacterized protein YecE (DUF72 family)